MSEILNIKKAAERKLSLITPAVPTGYEAVDFNPPVDLMYQRCQFRIDTPDDPSLPVGFHREQVQMQVFICDIKGHGTGAAIARSELIRSTFKRGLSMIEGNARIRVLTTPHIGSAFISNDRVIVPVMIELTCDIDT